jgi:hypothetical protein
MRPVSLHKLAESALFAIRSSILIEESQIALIELGEEGVLVNGRQRILPAVAREINSQHAWVILRAGIIHHRGVAAALRHPLFDALVIGCRRTLACHFAP